MSYSFEIAGSDRESLKAAVWNAQATEENQYGIPGEVAQRIVVAIDRIKFYDYPNKKWGIYINVNGHDGEQGCNHSMTIRPVPVA